MKLTRILAALVGPGLAGVAARLWPQVMTSAREHLLPWIDRNVPDLAGSVRLAFHDLTRLAIDLGRAALAAWCRLRAVLVSQVATFVELFTGGWAIRITSRLRCAQDRHRLAVTLTTEHELDWAGLPEQIRATALAGGLSGARIDIVRARDQFLMETV